MSESASNEPRSIIIIAPQDGDAAARGRHRSTSAGLSALGHRVIALEGRFALARTTVAALLRRRTDCADAAIATSPGLAGLIAGLALRRRGVPLLIDLPRRRRQGRAQALAHRLRRRLLLAADAITVPDAPLADALHRDEGVTAAVAPDGASIEALLRGLPRRGERDGALRVLLLGPFNSPHVEHLAVALHARGCVLQVGGSAWPGLPRSTLPEQGVPLRTLTFPRLAWVRRQVRDFEPDVVHAHWMPFAAAAVVARVSPLVATAWGSDVFLAKGRQARLNRVALRRVDAATADSDALRERLVELGAPAERTMLLQWGVDLARFSAGTELERERARESFGLGPGPIVLSHRGIKDIYNHDTIVAAHARLSEQLPGVQLIVKHFGATPEELEALRALPRVRLIGQLDYGRIPLLFRAADLCISIASSDSSPRSVWEAMACGCPCVLSDLPWVHELIDDGVHALVVPIDETAVADACRRILGDADLAARLAANGRALVERHHDRERELDRLERLYHQLVRRA